MAYIWKDQFDPDNFHLGVKAPHGYSIWLTVFVDSISDLFGQEIYEWARKLPPGLPTEIQLTMKEV